MKLTKENVYINLQGKSEAELTDLYYFLESVGEKQYRKTLKSFLDYCRDYETYHLGNNWTLSWYSNTKEKTEVTIEQLKEILQTMETETLQEKEHRLLEELEEVRKAIEEESNIKIGDWVKRTYSGIEIFKADNTHDYRYINSERHIYQKITNPEIINFLENLYNE